MARLGKIGDVNYKIQNVRAHRKTSVVHVQRLEVFIERNEEEEVSVPEEPLLKEGRGSTDDWSQISQISDLFNNEERPDEPLRRSKRPVAKNLPKT